MFLTVSVLPSTADGWEFVAPRAEAGYARDHVLVRFKPEAVGTRVADIFRVPLKEAPALLSLPEGIELVDTGFGRWRQAQERTAPAGGGDEEPAIVRLDRYVYLRLPAGMTVTGCLEALRDHPLVEYAEPDYVGTGGETIPNDPDFSSQWHHQNPAGGTPPADIRSVDAWDITRGSSNVVVAVLDTGLNTALAEFAGRSVPGYDFANNDANPADDHGHGTAVSGTVGANADNSTVVAGMNWHCRLMPVKVLDAGNFGFYSWWADGIDWAVANGCKVINLSAGGSSSDTTLSNAIMNAIAQGVIFVTITHNDGSSSVRFPGRMKSCITVGATKEDDARRSSSNYGETTDLVAPGQNIRTVSTSGNLATWSGTSFAAPLVTGVAALLAGLHPDLTHNQAEQFLRAGADDGVGNPAEDTEGFDIYHGTGRLNAYTSLQLATNNNAEVLTKLYVMDGALSNAEEATRLVSNGLGLYADFNGRLLYVATGDAGEGNDHFILVTDEPAAPVSAPWVKAGWVEGLRHFLADENDNDFEGWFIDGAHDATYPAATRAVNGGVLEGTLDLVAAFGHIPSRLYLAAVPYQNPDGGALVAGSQAPPGNGDGNVESNEYHALDMTVFDTDRDGLPDLQEDLNANGVMDPGESGARVWDSDGDGLDDGTEVNTYGSDPTRADTDGDRMHDGDEVAAGTDPTDAGSVFAVRGAFPWDGTNVALRWTGGTGKTFTIWSAPRVDVPFTNRVATDLPGSKDGTNTFVIPVPATTQALYRLEVPEE